MNEKVFVTFGNVDFYMQDYEKVSAQDDFSSVKTLGVVFEHNGNTQLPEDMVVFIRNNLGCTDLSSLEYLFVLEVGGSSKKALRMAEDMFSRNGCLPSYCSVLTKENMALTEKEISNQTIKIAPYVIGAKYCLKKHFKAYLS